ncbi:MAG: class I SAM-dependent methyltransferase [Planctomycetota bacterium]
MDCPETPYLREAGYAERYRDQRFRSGSGVGTHRREVQALEALLAALLTDADTTGPWLDVPAGAGRLTGVLPAAPSAVQADRNLSMLQAAGPDHRRICAAAQRLPFPDGAFAGVLCMRLLHHIPGTEERVAILRELARVSRGPVVLSFFHALSLQHLRRVLRHRLWGRRQSSRHAIRFGTLAQELRAAGLVLVKTRPLRRFVSEQWLVLARRGSR